MNKRKSIGMGNAVQCLEYSMRNSFIKCPPHISLEEMALVQAGLQCWPLFVSINKDCMCSFTREGCLIYLHLYKDYNAEQDLDFASMKMFCIAMVNFIFLNAYMCKNVGEHIPSSCWIICAKNIKPVCYILSQFVNYQQCEAGDL